jgi:hypothetical protein
VKSVFQLMIKQAQRRLFKRNGKIGKESKVAERQREIECVCTSVDRNR